MDNNGIRVGGTATKAPQRKLPPRLKNGRERRGELLASPPFLDLLEQLREDTAALSRAIPNSEVHALHRRFQAQLSAALEESKHIAVWVRLVDIWCETGTPMSTLTRLCRKHGEKIGARKQGGAWLVNWQAYEAFSDTQSKRREGNETCE